MHELPPHADVVFVGAGHNALVAAAYLLDAGRSVCLLEQMPQPGGWVRTEELGAPGFQHDRWSSLHPAFVGGPAWAELGPDLRRHGLEYVTAPLATGSSLPDGRTAVAPVDPEAFAGELDRLAETAGWNALFAAAGPQLPPLAGLLAAGLDSPQAQATLAGLLRDTRAGALPFGQLLAGTAVELVRGHFVTEELRSLAAPWPLHVGAGPEDPTSALWAVVALAALAGGNPTPVGGSGRLAAALVGLVTERGGDLVCNVEVDRVLVRDGRAVGVRTTAGTTVQAREAVIVATTPDRLYGRLLRDTPGVPAAVRPKRPATATGAAASRSTSRCRPGPTFATAGWTLAAPSTWAAASTRWSPPCARQAMGCCPSTPRSPGTNRPPSTPPAPLRGAPWSACRSSTSPTPPAGTRPGPATAPTGGIPPPDPATTSPATTRWCRPSPSVLSPPTAAATGPSCRACG
jgi:phytoene dehydrogenase-like protein